VIASGIDLAYPPEHADLQEAVASQGLLLSEHPPGTEPIARHFGKNPLVTGLTHTAHPVSLAAGLATLDVIREEGLVERADRLDEVLARKLAEIAARHPESVSDVRSLGLYGVIEFKSDSIVKTLGRSALDRGIHVATRWNYVFVAPPLCIEEADLVGGLEIVGGLA